MGKKKLKKTSIKNFKNIQEELGNGGKGNYARSLPPLSPRPTSRAAPLAPFIDDNFFSKKGNTKKGEVKII